MPGINHDREFPVRLPAGIVLATTDQGGRRHAVALAGTRPYHDGVTGPTLCSSSGRTVTAFDQAGIDALRRISGGASVPIPTLAPCQFCRRLLRRRAEEATAGHIKRTGAHRS